MANILIVTPYGLFNYGNRLQNFALTHKIEQLGNSCGTIAYYPAAGFGPMVKELAKPLVWNPLNRSVRARRYRAFQEFDRTIKKYKVRSKSNLADLANKADLFCIGSDQIWNPDHLTDPDFQFAAFSPKQKCIAYAPSFGIDVLPPQYVNEYRSGLDSIGSISVREVAGARIIKELTGLDVPVVLDPTLLLDEGQWDAGSSVRMVPDGDDVFSYFLGNNVEQQRRLVDEYCEREGLQNVEVMNLSSPLFYEAGPQDFIALIKNASLICTNSFHAAVFSLIYERPLNIFERSDAKEASMNSRIINFVSQFDLNESLVSDGEGPQRVSLPYAKAKALLSIKRSESEEFLKRALESR